MILALLLAACAPPGGDSSPAADSDPADSGGPAVWDYDGPTGDGQLLDAATLADALAWELDHLLGIDPQAFQTVYLAHLDWGAGTCPEVQEMGLHEVYWSGYCTAPTGAEFHGWALSRRDPGVSDGVGGVCPTLDHYFGFSRITPPDAPPLDGWGSADFTDCTSGKGVRSIAQTVIGTFSLPGAEDWLGDAVPLELSWAATASADARSLVIDGGYSDLVAATHTAVLATRMEEVRFDPASGCTAEPEGTLLLWDLDGAEYTVTFGDSCDGCGEATSGGVEVGEVCADFAPYFAYVDAL